jgi:hypothetical protein
MNDFRSAGDAGYETQVHRTYYTWWSLLVLPFTTGTIREFYFWSFFDPAGMPFGLIQMLKKAKKVGLKVQTVGEFLFDGVHVKTYRQIR